MDNKEKDMNKCDCKNEQVEKHTKKEEKCNCKEEKKDCGCKKENHHTHKKDNKLEEKLKQSENKIKELEDKLARQSADTINYRRRKEEEVSRMLKFCNEDLIKQMLPILDNFERAIKLDDDNLEDEVSKFLEGFKMIYCNMQGVMESFDVKAIDGANKPFDPVYHNAIMVEHRDGVENGMVLEVLQKGYIYKDKVIRPAMVKVSE